MKSIAKKDIKYINTSRLTSKRPYQREINPHRVRKIADEWDDLMMKPIQVADINGELVVWDGQHTMAAAIVHNGNKDLDVPCLVEKMTDEQAANAIATQYDRCSKHSSIDLFHVRLQAKDKDTINIDRILSEYDVRISTNSGKNISCVKTIQRIYKLGPHELTTVIKIITLAWPNDNDRFKTEVVEAMEKIVRTYKSFNENRLISVLSDDKVATYMREARSLTVGSAPAKLASVFIKRYNYKLKKDNRLNADLLF